MTKAADVACVTDPKYLYHKKIYMLWSGKQAQGEPIIKEDNIENCISILKSQSRFSPRYRRRRQRKSPPVRFCHEKEQSTLFLYEHNQGCLQAISCEPGDRDIRHGA